VGVRRDWKRHPENLTGLKKTAKKSLSGKYEIDTEVVLTNLLE
jgi:hypothetical protein